MSCGRRSVPFPSFPITFCILICVISSSRCCGFHHQSKLPSKSKSFSIDNKWTVCCTRHSSISLIHADVRVQACWVHVATQPRSRGPPSCLSSLCVHLCLYCVCNKLALAGVQWRDSALLWKRLLIPAIADFPSPNTTFLVGQQAHPFFF